MIPNYSHATFVEGNPRMRNQSWQNTHPSNPCYFTCETNYTWNNLISSCVANTKNFICSEKPINTVWNTVNSYTQTWNGTVWSPLDSATIYSTTASIESCHYVCDTGYSWDNGLATCSQNSCIIPNPINAILTP